MKNLTIFVFCMIFTTSFAFAGEGVERMERNAAAQAWASVNVPLPEDTPSISGGGLVVESEINGVGRKVWLTFSQPGSYLLLGHTCSGEEVRLGELGWETNPYTPQGSVLIYDGNVANLATPFLPQLCVIGAIRVGGGQIERSVAEINPWGRSASVEFPIGSEGFTSDGKYYLALLPLQEDTTVILGREVIAEEIRRSPAGSIVVFPQVGMPPPGPTTLTVCGGGQCASTVFQRKLAVSANNGKG